MKKHNTRPPLGEAAEAAGGLLRQGVITFALLGGSSVRIIREFLQSLGPSEQCDCEILPPCWLPRPLGEATSYVCKGGTATLRLRVTNGCMNPQKLLVRVTGEDAAGVKLAPPVLNLGAMERGVVGISFPVALAAPCGETHEIIIWLHGCREHFLRWTIKVASRGVDTCDEVEVEDGPDLIHHWYDHFYCHRPCTDRKS
jgi:hypothetical protein